MLVLGRFPGEKILIPALDIEICILGVEGMNVRVGINAPKEVTVLREEVQLRNQEKERKNG